MANLTKASGENKADAAVNRPRVGKSSSNIRVETHTFVKMDPKFSPTPEMPIEDPMRPTVPLAPINQRASNYREKVFTRAVEVIENEERALRWMGTPIKVLGFATPVSLLRTAKGRSAVLKILGQLEHGVW